MKKIIAVVLVSIFILTLVGCGNHTDSDEQTNDSMQNEWGITLEKNL